MKVYDINDGFCYSQTHSVIAKNMATAETLYKKVYPGTTIKSITLHSEYVIIQEDISK